MGMTAGCGAAVGSGMSDLPVLEQMYECFEDLSSGRWSDDLEAAQLDGPRVEAPGGRAAVVGSRTAETEELLQRVVPEEQRVERGGVGVAGRGRVLTRPEGVVEGKRLAVVLQDAVVGRQGQRAHEHAVPPDRE